MVATVEIRFSSEYPPNHGRSAVIAAAYGPSLAAAFEQIYAECGIKPGVKWELGGARTFAQGKKANPYLDPRLSDHYLDGVNAAVDIDNQRAIRNALGSARFEQIMAGNGWHNMQIDGEPFPEEPWHFACHSLALPNVTVVLIDSQEGNAMSTTFPTKYRDTATGKTTFARRRGLRIQYTTDVADVQRWKQELGGTKDHPSLGTPDAYLKRWAHEIAEDQADLAAVFGQVLDVEALAARLIAALPTAEEIADELSDRT